jgi:hypothetical protein
MVEGFIVVGFKLKKRGDRKEVYKGYSPINIDTISNMHVLHPELEEIPRSGPSGIDLV